MEYYLDTGNHEHPRIPIFKRLQLPHNPYAMVGADRLTSAIYKDGSERTGWRYHFNLFRMSTNGTVDQSYGPADLVSLLKIVRVLAATLEDDGCLPPSRRNELRQIVQGLDHLLEDMKSARGDGAQGGAP